ncbi:MAG: hypothetical protein ABI165_09145, partial [Bryobacteraceae bacterium]
GRLKADGVADAINRLLQNLVIKCAKSEGVRDYYHVGVIGYGSKVGPALSGELSDRTLVPISELAEHPQRIEERTRKMDDGAGGLVDQTVRFPVWFDAASKGGTPMCEALALAERTVRDWIAQHPSSFPPIVTNISDGESTDGDPTTAAQRIQGLTTDDGAALLFNIHLSSNRAAPVEFPDSDAQLADRYSRLLFGMSSDLPSHIQQAARSAARFIYPNSMTAAIARSSSSTMKARTRPMARDPVSTCRRSKCARAIFPNLAAPFTIRSPSIR